MITVDIHISGLVQGVGFRPFVYRIAAVCKLKGEVENRNDGVFITVTGSRERVEEFTNLLRSEAPPASRIDSLKVTVAEARQFSDFRIISSGSVSEAVTGVSPDIALCSECLEDMKSQHHRISYPFINCTNCGPRFTIIRELPYDRDKTTMDIFPMCEVCRSEYEDVSDRRFHAQPVACNSCGPLYSMVEDEAIVTDTEKIVSKMAELIVGGGIVAIKGMGGYHLVCDAGNEKAVKELRRRKEREGKPFAVMCRDAEAADRIAVIDEESRRLMESWQRPIVLVESKGRVAPSVTNGLSSAGILLPYMPVHYMLFEKLGDMVVVFTSANLSDEPVITDDTIAAESLKGIADKVISYNREINNRADDSVVKVMAGRSMPFRRSRGYAPGALPVSFRTEGIFGAGAELVNCFALGKGEEVIMSQYIGDLKNRATLDFYEESYRLFSHLFRFTPSLVARDLHPDYLSSRFAERLAGERGAELISVQHHHAHIAACLADNNFDGEVIGLSLDGVGLGDDGNIWGGEVMVASAAHYERLLHFDYVPLVGADRVSNEPWRSGVGYLLKYCSDTDLVSRISELMGVDSSTLSLYGEAVSKGVNSHLYSSAGRLFDAVAAISGVNTRSLYHAEAPMRLESVAAGGVTEAYDFESGKGIISFGPAIAEAARERVAGQGAGLISARFHNCVVNALTEAVTEVSQAGGLKTVVLSGGTFQNSYITNRLHKELTRYGYRVLLHGSVPPNDSGIALGQVAVAAAINRGKG